MASTYSVSLRFELQGTGENLNTWGTRLNLALTRIDKAIAGRAAIVLTGGVYTLSVSNAVPDEASAAYLDLSGVGGGSVVIPSVSKLYWVRNGSSAPVTVTTGAGATVVLGVGDATWVTCNGADCITSLIGGQSFKAYVDTQTFALVSGYLPGQGGSAGMFLKTNGTVAGWAQPQTSDLSDYASDQAAKLTAAKLYAISMAVSL